MRNGITRGEGALSSHPVLRDPKTPSPTPTLQICRAPPGKPDQRDLGGAPRLPGPHGTGPAPPPAAGAHSSGWLSLLVKRALSVAKAGCGGGGGGSFPLEELPLDLDGEHPVAHGQPPTDGGADMLRAGGRGAGAGAGRGAGRGAAGEGRAAGARASLARLLRLLRRLGDFPGAAALLLHVLDDAHGHRLPHVAHGKAACGEGVRV